MPPDFNKKTVEILARRAAYLCSNPDCRVSTVGPNSDPKKATIIGEAAHIYGARPKAKRYVENMTDAARANIINGIWLCRNCHKRIDVDGEKFSSEILFLWREEHEKHVQADLGNKTDRIRYEQQSSLLLPFKGYPPIIRRIVIDKPDGWEWRLTAELMRYLNKPHFKKIKNLRNGLYVKSQEHLNNDNAMEWVKQRLSEFFTLTAPLGNLISQLKQTWGTQGEPGDIEEIHHTCCLISSYLEQVVMYEERLYFVNPPDEYSNIINLLRDFWGSQVEKLQSVPDYLDEVMSILNTDHGGTKENPRAFEKTIVVELPSGWVKKINREIKKLERDNSYAASEDQPGYLVTIVVVAVVVFLVFMVT